MMGLPAEDVPDELPDSESGDEAEETEEASDSEEDDSQGRDARSTQFGLPSSDEEASEGSAPAIDTAATGPDDDVQDWSDLDEAVEEEADEGSSLSARGAPDDEHESEQQRAEPSEPEEESASARRADSEERESRKTHMGMPRFDPDRVAPDEESDSEGEMGNEGTAPGRPQESEDAEVPGADEEKTRQIDIDSLKEQVDEIPGEGDSSPGSEVIHPSGETDSEPSEEGDEPVDPGSTLHGKAGKAMGAGFREPEQPDQSSERVDDSSATAAPGQASDSAPDEGEHEEGAAEASDRERHGTVRGLVAGDVRPESEASEDEGDEGDQLEESGSEMRNTQLGQPVGDPSQRPSADTGDSEETSDSATEEESDPSDLFARVEETQSGELPDEELEEVDFDDEVDDVENEFEFGSLPSPDEVLSETDEETPSESESPSNEETIGSPPADEHSEQDREFEEDRTIEESEPVHELGEDERVEASEPVQELGEGDVIEEPGRAEPEPAGQTEPDAPEEPGPAGQDGGGEAAPPAAESAPNQEEPASTSRSMEVEPEGPPVADVGGAQSAIQTVAGIIAGLTLGAFLGVQTTAPGGLVANYMVLALTLASGLGTAAAFITPFVATSSRTKSMVYLGIFLIVGALAVSVILLAGGFAVGPSLALCGAVLAGAASLVPAMQ